MDNEAKSISHLLNKLNIKTEYKLTANSFYEFSKILHRNNISTMIINVKISQDTDMMFPFIAKRKNGNFVLVESKTSEGLSIDENNTISSIDYDKFESEFDENIILLEKIYSEDYYINKSKTLPFNIENGIIVTLLLIGAVAFYINVSGRVGIFEGVLQIINLVGIFLAFSYFLKENGIGNKGFDLICKEVNGNNPCATIKKPNSTFLSFSTIGLSYFLAVFLIFLYSIGSQSHSSSLLYITMTILGLPVMLYSIYMQLFVNKKTCKICLLILSVFIIELIYVVQLIMNNPISINWLFELKLLILSLFSFIIVLLFSIYLKTQSKYRKLNNQWNSIWSEPSVLNVMRHNSPEKIIGFNDNIVFGDHNAKFIIDLIIHVNCKHCVKALEELGNLVKLNERFKLRLYIMNRNEPVDQKMLNHLAIKCKKGDLTTVIKMFKDWKSKKSENYPSIEISKENKQMLSRNEAFCQENTFNFYPTFLFDNTKVPSFIDYENVKVALANFSY